MLARIYDFDREEAKAKKKNDFFVDTFSFIISAFDLNISGFGPYGSGKLLLYTDRLTAFAFLLRFVIHSNQQW